MKKDELTRREVMGMHVAYDRCHKLYVIEDNDDLKNARVGGYAIYPISDLEELYTRSCSLRFISNWKLTKRYVSQYTEKVVFEESEGIYVIYTSQH